MQRFIIRIRESKQQLYVNSILPNGDVFVTDRISGVRLPDGKIAGSARLFHSFESANEYIKAYKAIPIPKGKHHVRLWIEETKPTVKSQEQE